MQSSRRVQLYACERGVSPSGARPRADRATGGDDPRPRSYTYVLMNINHNHNSLKINDYT